MKTALITGGAQRIGKSIALELGKDGYHVLLHYFHAQQAAEETAVEIRQFGGACSLFQADLENPDAIHAMMEKISGEFQGLDVLINNASSFQESSLTDTTIEEWDRLLNINLRAPWICAKLCRSLLSTSHGCIINILDSGIEKVWPRFAVYQTSKVGLAHLTQLMAKEYAPEIRVNGIAPGLILPASTVHPDDWEKLVQRLPLKKQGSPADVVQAIMFLLHQEYMTGEILFVDGGYQLT